MKKIFYILLLTTLLLAACANNPAGSGADTQSPAAQAVEAYLKSLADKDENRMTQLICGDWEAQALLEYDSFGGVQTSLDGVSCQQSGSEGETVLVNCQGVIKASYSNEVQDFDLSPRTYQVTKSGSDWQVCGYSVK